MSAAVEPATPGDPFPAPRSDDHGRRWWLTLAAIVVIGLALRVCNLGSFSPWVDEMITMRFAALPMQQLLASSAGDAENVPVYLVVTHLARRLGLDEPWMRLPSILAGLGSILLLALWVRRRFGAGVALLTAAFCALSPFHIRYSQELRAYPHLLLLVALALLAGDRLRRRPDLGSAALLAAIVGLGFYTHLTFVLVLAPLVGGILGPDGGIARNDAVRTLVGRLALAIGLGAAAFLPWLFRIDTTLGERMSRGGVKDWTLDRIAERFHFLTVAPWESREIGALGFAFAVLALLGIWAAARQPTGRTVLLVSLATLVVWEATLVAVDHWTEGRYDTALWPFLAVIVGLGTHALLRMLRWPVLQVAAGGLLVVALLGQVDRYHELGRPHWDAVGEAIRLVRRPGEPVLAVNQETRDSVAHSIGPAVESIEGDVRRIVAALESDASVLLAYGGWRGSAEVRRLARRATLLLHVPQPPYDADLYRIPREVVTSGRPLPAAGPLAAIVWPDPAAELLPRDLGRPTPGCLRRLVTPVLGSGAARPQTPPIRVDATRFDDLGSGWSTVRTRPDGTSYRWVRGREASLEVEWGAAGAAQIEVGLRPPPGLPGPQALRLVVNGHEIGRSWLDSRGQAISMAAPAPVLRIGRNLVVLQFSTALPSPEASSPWDGPPPRAAAVDWVEVHPLDREVDDRSPG